MMFPFVDILYIVYLRSFCKLKNMIVINIKDNESIDRALKRFKKKFEKTGALRELRSRTFFTKPSVVRREQIKKAAYIQNLRDLESK